MIKNRLIFVTSLERSGSTLLDLTLGRHPNLVSFGEASRVLLPHGHGGMRSVFDRPCSCGEVVKACPFWGEVTARIHSREDQLSLPERYSIFLARFRELFGDSFVPVDSSKYLQAMEALQQLRDVVDVSVLFAVRDVRGWASSSRSAAKRKQEIPYGMLFSAQIKEFWKPYLRYNVLRHFPFWLPLEWYLRNGRINRFLSRAGFKSHRLSYERLAFNPHEALSRIFEFVGVEDVPIQDRSTSHIVRGNRMAFDPSSNQVIRYDAQWLTDLWTQYEAMVWPFVMRRNARWVYRAEKR